MSLPPHHHAIRRDGQRPVREPKDDVTLQKSWIQIVVICEALHGNRILRQQQPSGDWQTGMVQNATMPFSPALKHGAIQVVRADRDKSHPRGEACGTMRKTPPGPRSGGLESCLTATPY